MTTIDFTPQLPESVNDACRKRVIHNTYFVILPKTHMTTIDCTPYFLESMNKVCPREIGHVKDTLSFNTTTHA